MADGRPASGDATTGPAHPALDRFGRFVPGVALARRYERAWLPNDIVAGLVLTAILIPAGMGYASAIGLPPITGLYASVLPLVAYAVFGPSRILIVGPDSSLVPLVAAAVIPIADGDAARAAELAALLALMAGVIVVAGGIARLGLVTDLLSIPVREGYINGIAALIIASQLPKLFGFSIEAQTFFDEIAQWAQGIRDGRTNAVALAIGVTSLLVILAIRHWRPRLPGILVAVVGATLVSAALDLQGRAGIDVVGGLPAGLPGLTLPPLDPALILALLPAAVSIALVSAADMSVLSQTYAARGRYEVDENQELIALGAANVASGLFGGFGVSSSATRTPVAESAGARTELTGVVGAIAIALLLVAAPGLLAAMPIATLAAVVIAAGLSLVDVHSFVRLWRVRRTEFAFGVASFIGVTFVGVIPGIFFAVALSLLAFVRNAWAPHDAVLGRAHGVKGYHDLNYFPDARQVPGLLLYRFDAPLFFANGHAFTQRIRQRISQASVPVRWVVVAAEPITDVDTTAAEALDDLLDRFEQEGITLAFAELKDPVKDRLREYGTLARIGEAKCYRTLGTAVDAYIEATGEAWVDWEDAAKAAAAATAAAATAAAATAAAGVRQGTEPGASGSTPAPGGAPGGPESGPQGGPP